MEEKNVCVICGKEVTDTTLITAYTALNSKNFTTAKTLFREYVLANADSAEGYFGLACAKLNLRFDSAFGGKYSLVPTYYLDVDIMHDVDFIKALKLATSDLSQEYMSAFAGVTHILGVWKSKIQKESPYDIFISYKESDEEAGIERTQDSIEAQDLYVYLSSLGYRVFYARESLRGKSDLEKEAYTYQAISTSKLMIVYGQKIEYIDSLDMSSEWGRYKDLIDTEQKAKDSMLVAYEKVAEEDILKIFGSVTTIDAHKKSFLIDIRDAVASRVVDETKVETKSDSVMDMHLRQMSRDNFTRKLSRVLNYVMFGFIGLSVLSLLVWIFMYNVTGIHKVLSNVLNVTLLVSVITSITLATILAFKDAGNNFKYLSVIVGSCACLGMAIFGLFATNYIPDSVRRTNDNYGNYLYRGYDFDYVIDENTKDKCIKIYGIDKFFEATKWDIKIPKRMLGCDVESIQILDNDWLRRVYLDTTICKSLKLVDCENLKLIDISVTHTIRDLYIEDCEELERIAFNDVENIAKLTIKECDSLRRLNLKNVLTVTLIVEDCEDLYSILIPKAKTINFKITDCESLGNIDFSSVERIDLLWLTSCPLIDNIDFNAVKVLQNFKLVDCPSVDIIQFRNCVSLAVSMNFALSRANYTLIIDSKGVLDTIDRDESAFRETSKNNFPVKLLLSKTVVNGLLQPIGEVITWLDKYTYTEEVNIDNVTYLLYTRNA